VRKPKLHHTHQSAELLGRAVYAIEQQIAFERALESQNLNSLKTLRCTINKRLRM
jgi:hypothetical protein